MTKEFLQPRLNIGIVGHIDHGKTTLMYKLTGVWADKHSEELKRGITIKLGYASLFIRKCKDCNKLTIKQECQCGSKKTEIIDYVSFVDAPGHEMLMATMLGGAAIIDAAILVIAANEPFPQPQTKEHLLALESKQVKQIIIIQNKLDLVNKEEALKQHEQIKEFIKGTIAENAVIIPISAQQGINIDSLLETIIKIKTPERDIKSGPLFLIARSFDANRPGSSSRDLFGGILGGTLIRGKLKVGDEIEIKPGSSIKKHDKREYRTITTKIATIQSGDNKITEALPGGSLAIQTELDPFMTKADNLAGNTLGLKFSLPDPIYSIRLKTNIFKEIVGAREKLKVEPIKTNESLLLSVNTSTTVGTVTSARDHIIEVFLKIPIVPFSGDRVGIARNYQGHWRLIGWGEIKE